MSRPYEDVLSAPCSCAGCGVSQADGYDVAYLREWDRWLCSDCEYALAVPVVSVVA